jgi:hypothetical protein
LPVILVKPALLPIATLSVMAKPHLIIEQNRRQYCYDNAVEKSIFANSYITVTSSVECSCILSENNSLNPNHRLAKPKNTNPGAVESNAFI